MDSGETYLTTVVLTLGRGVDLWLKAFEKGS
jgi:hypothetical protein